MWFGWDMSPGPPVPFTDGLPLCYSEVSRAGKKACAHKGSIKFTNSHNLVHSLPPKKYKDFLQNLDRDIV